MSKELRDKTRTMLNSYHIYKSDIKNLELEIQELQNNYDLSALSYGESSGKTNKISQESQDRIANKDMQLKKLQIQIDNNRINVAKIDTAVLILTEIEHDVIYYKYLVNTTTTWPMVSRKVGFTVSACVGADRRALDKLTPLLIR